MSAKKKREIICIIDDDTQVLKALSRELADYMREERLLLRTYSSPKEFLRELDDMASEVSVVISDLRMAELKGSDLLLTVHESFPDIELMLLTAYHDMQDIRIAVTAAIRALILKPWDPESLLAEIDKARMIYLMRRENRSYLEKIKAQLEVAGEFQRKLLSIDIPQEIAHQIRIDYLPYPRLKVGGDYYDVLPVDEHRFFVLIGDVTGHGVKPAFVSAMLKVVTLALARTHVLEGRGPASVLEEINRQLCDVLKNTNELLITFSCLLFDTREMKLTYSNAGHLPIYILRSGHCSSYLIEGPAMGFSPDIRYREESYELQEGDIVAVYTDGLLESEIEHTKISDEAVKRFLVQSASASDFNKEVLRRLKLVREIDDFHDDVTFISVKV